MSENHGEEENKLEVVFEPVTEKMKCMLLSDMKFIPSLKFGTYDVKLEFDEPPEINEIARKELRETPEITRDAILQLQSLLKGEKNLRVPLHKNEWMIRFLRPCKFYPQSAFELIKRYYQFKVTHSDIYNDLKPSNAQTIFQNNILLLHIKRDQHGRRILTVKLGRDWKPNVVTLHELFKGMVMILELGALEPQTQICGCVVILDFNGLSFKQTTYFTPSFLKRLLDWLQDCIPMRIKNVHVVNQPFLFNIVYNLCKPFLKEKLKKRLILHGKNYESLHSHINPDCLTPDYGGTMIDPISSLNKSVWLEILKLCDEEYEAINSYGYQTQKY